MAQIRAELADYADGIGLSASEIEDVQTIATEACGNSIKHAYDASVDGCIEVTAGVEDGELRLLVRDFGSGVGPRTTVTSPSLHAGLAIIGALSNSFRLSSRRGVGTEIEVRLSLGAA